MATLISMCGLMQLEQVRIVTIYIQTTLVHALIILDQILLYTSAVTTIVNHLKIEEELLLVSFLY